MEMCVFTWVTQQSNVSAVEGAHTGQGVAKLAGVANCLATGHTRNQQADHRQSNQQLLRGTRFVR